MASFADTLVQAQVQATTPGTPDIAGNLQQGAQLAQHAEQLQMQQEELAQKKQQLVEARLEKFANAVEKGQQYAGKAQANYYNKFLPQYKNALGLKDMITDDSLAFMTASPENASRFNTLVADVREGRIKAQDAFATLGDPTQFADVTPAMSQQIQDAQKSLLGNQAQMAKTVYTQQSTDVRQKDAQNSAGKVELSKKVADKYNEYAAGGGRAGIESAMTNLKEAAAALDTGAVKTGGISTKIPWLKSDDAQSMLNPEMVKFKTKAQGALNSILRATLGAQFTEKEGERVLAQVWDDRQPPKVNAAKISSKITELKKNVSSAESEFRRFGYLQGESAAAPAQKAAPDAPPVDVAKLRAVIAKFPDKLEEIAKRQGMSVQQLQKLIGGQ